jgi:hypothetical protein
MLVVQKAYFTPLTFKIIIVTYVYCGGIRVTGKGEVGVVTFVTGLPDPNGDRVEAQRALAQP